MREALIVLFLAATLLVACAETWTREDGALHLALEAAHVGRDPIAIDPRACVQLGHPSTLDPFYAGFALRGSGVVVHRCEHHATLVLTAGHVGDVQLARVQVAGGETADWAVAPVAVRSGDGVDLALWRLEPPDNWRHAVDLLLEDDRPEHDLARVSWLPRQVPESYAVYYRDRTSSYYPDPIYPGDSGSPLLCGGRLAGIVTGVDDRTPHVGFHVPVDAIRAFLADVVAED